MPAAKLRALARAPCHHSCIRGSPFVVGTAQPPAGGILSHLTPLYTEKRENRGGSGPTPHGEAGRPRMRGHEYTNEGASGPLTLVVESRRGRGARDKPALPGSCRRL